LRRRKGQIVEIKRIDVEIEEIQGCFPAPIRNDWQQLLLPFGPLLHPFLGARLRR
jgi:hypothetical protein